MTTKFLRNFACRKCETNIGKTVEHKEKTCDEVKIVRQFTYLGNRVCAGGGHEVAVTAWTRCEWDKLRECSELLYGRRFPSKLTGVVHKSHVKPAILWA